VKTTAAKATGSAAVMVMESREKSLSSSSTSVKRVETSSADLKQAIQQ
jgi:hypothetical protein